MNTFYIKPILFTLIFILSLSSCNDDEFYFPLLTFDNFVEIKTPSTSAKFTQVFAKFTDNVFTVTAHPIGGSSESVSFQFEYLGEQAWHFIDTGSESKDEGSYMVYMSDLIAFETGDGNVIYLAIKEFNEETKTIKGHFRGHLGETDSPDMKLEILESNFYFQYSE